MHVLPDGRLPTIVAVVNITPWTYEFTTDFEVGKLSGVSVLEQATIRKQDITDDPISRKISGYVL